MVFLPWIISFVGGTVIAGLLMYFIQKIKTETLQNRVSELSESIHRADSEKTQLLSDNESMKLRIRGMEKDLENASEKQSWLEQAQKILGDTFAALSAKALNENAEQFMQRANDQLQKVSQQLKGDWNTQHESMKNLVEPLAKELGKMEKQVNELETRREGAYQGITQQIRGLSEAQGNLTAATTSLTQALKSSSSRGQWGELQLRNIVEMAGLVNHVDFEEQVSGDQGRPDMIIKLPNGGIIPVDAKAPMASFLSATETDDENKKKELLIAHAKSVRNHVDTLKKKAYWDQFKDNAPEFVVMALPYESGLPAAFDVDAKLFEDAMRAKVIIASPVTLLALLKVIAYGWMQLQLADNARKIADQSRELYERFMTMAGHIQKLGSHLQLTVKDYNSFVGSMESRVIPAGEKLEEMGISTKELPALNPVIESIRLPEKTGE